ncbi:MAG: lysophospholipid acyltransferase family protein [Sulfurimonas sp.]|jgi:predicted LPLAT superfamily acyltransferase|nr:lysophospholipid acyltransferase family protein [Sulfurimonas sp.]
MGVKQYGNALGHKVILTIYKLLGYRFVSFILNFVALYYVLFTPSVKQSLESYYKHLGKELSYKAYFKHIKLFSLSIFDRFISRNKADELSFERENREAFLALQEGGIVLLSHIGGWATAGHSMKADIPPMNIVMHESTKGEISEFEKSKQRQNETNVKIIDLNQGAIAANIQIANALMNKEVVAMMADRVTDPRKVVLVDFLGSKVEINKNPFDIAHRFNKPLVATFVVLTKEKHYKLIFENISINEKSLEEIAQEYMNILTKIIKIYPNQWYNFYDFFNPRTINVNKQ